MLVKPFLLIATALLLTACNASPSGLPAPSGSPGPQAVTLAPAVSPSPNPLPTARPTLSPNASNSDLLNSLEKDTLDFGSDFSSLARDLQ